MKGLSSLLGFAGVVVIVAAAYGRFHAADTITVSGHSFAAGTILLVGNTLLVLAVWLGLCGRPR